MLQMIPQTSYFKLVDVWLLFCVSIITMSILMHTAIAAAFGLGGGTRTSLKLKESEQRAFKRIRSNSGASLEDDNEGEDDFRLAKLVNYVGFGLFVGIVVLFNIVFWSVALKEYKMEGEQLLEIKKPIR